MEKVSLVNVDQACGVIGGPGSNKLIINGNKAAILGDYIVGGDFPSVIIQGSSKLYSQGIPVAFNTCMCSCGHTVTGSSKLIISK